MIYLIFQYINHILFLTIFELIFAEIFDLCFIKMIFNEYMHPARVDVLPQDQQSGLDRQMLDTYAGLAMG
ncbi:MAG: hypothetical protein NEHIOOID_01251 [Holosporales bacterium]